jgi:hypothetical protein
LYMYEDWERETAPDFLMKWMKKILWYGKL